MVMPYASRLRAAAAAYGGGRRRAAAAHKAALKRLEIRNGVIQRKFASELSGAAID
jgi:hypothetical protein